VCACGRPGREAPPESRADSAAVRIAGEGSTQARMQAPAGGRLRRAVRVSYAGPSPGRAGTSGADGAGAGPGAARDGAGGGPAELESSGGAPPWAAASSFDCSRMRGWGGVGVIG
jgi:hypothetical protein